MYKLFSVQEATELIPLVDRTLREMQTALHDTVDVQDRLEDARPFSIQARNLAEELTFLLGTIHENKATLDRLGVHLKDVETGLVDFPSQLGSEVVYLSWKQGQHGITHYHRLNETETMQRVLPEQIQSRVQSV
jgi:hypothetical protein